MKYVLDSSVAVKWVLKEAYSDKAENLREEFRRAIHELVSPSVFAVESAHALNRAQKTKRIAVGEARKLLIDILSTGPVTTPYEPLLLRALDIASKCHIGVYDCLYAALGEREGCQVITADQKMINALQKDFPFIRDLATMP